MTKYSAYGIKLQKGIGVGAVDIAQITNLSGPGLSLDTVDVTEHDGDGWEEHIGTILRSGTITLDLLFDPALASHTTLIADMVAGTVNAYSIVFPNTGSTTWTFNAIVTGFSPSAPVDGALTASVTLKPSGVMAI